MSQRRMFSPQIVESEEFLSMPVSSQALYFHLGMNADDDGFIQPKITMRQVGSNDDDLKVLLTKRFLLSFDGGVVVIKHWLIHNLIQKDRYHPTRFQEQKKSLFIKDNKAYTENNHISSDSVNKMLPEVRLGKVRLENTIASFDAQEDEIIPTDEDGNPLKVKTPNKVSRYVAPFDFAFEVKKLEDSEFRPNNIIAFYFDERKWTCDNYAVWMAACKRHLQAAKRLVGFSDDQLVRGMRLAQETTANYTLETVLKVLTK